MSVNVRLKCSSCVWVPERFGLGLPSGPEAMEKTAGRLPAVVLVREPDCGLDDVLDRDHLEAAGLRFVDQVPGGGGAELGCQTTGDPGTGVLGLRGVAQA